MTRVSTGVSLMADSRCTTEGGPTYPGAQAAAPRIFPLRLEILTSLSSFSSDSVSQSDFAFGQRDRLLHIFFAFSGQSICHDPPLNAPLQSIRSTVPRMEARPPWAPRPR